MSTRPRFCRTDAPIAVENLSHTVQPLVQTPNPHRHARQRLGDPSVMLGFQACEGAPVHSLRFATRIIYDVWCPGQPLPDAVRSSDSAAVRGFPLALVGKIVAVAAGEDCTVVENRHASPASRRRTAKPWARSPEVARSPIQPHRVVLIFPLFPGATVTICEDHLARIRPHLDRGHGFTVAGPSPSLDGSTPAEAYWGKNPLAQAA